MDIFTHTIAYVTVDTTTARYLALGSQMFFHLQTQGVSSPLCISKLQ